MIRAFAKARLAIASALLLLSSAASCSGDDDASTSGSQTAGDSKAGATGAAGKQSSAGSASGADAAGTTAGASGGGGAAGMTAATPPMDDGLPTWTGIYTFSFHSCQADICHGRNVVGVNMTSKDAAYESLVDQPANALSMCAMLGKKRVVPGDPDNSLLYLKLDINAPCGQQMPVGGQLPAKQIQRVHDWIMMGAKND